MHGVVSGFASRRPRADELENLPHIEMTSSVEWDPSSTQWAQHESVIHEVTCERLPQVPDRECNERNVDRLISAVHTYQHAVGTEYREEGDELYERLVATVRVTSDDMDGNDRKIYPIQTQVEAPRDTDNGDVLRPSNARDVNALVTSEVRNVITPESLARRWGCGLAIAAKTLKATTQAGVRNVLAQGERKVRQRLNHLKFPSLSGKYFTDTMFANSKSIRGHKTAQVSTNGSGFDYVYPLATKGKASDGLMSFIQDAGIPQTLVSDGSKEQLKATFAEISRAHHIKREVTVPHSPWQNLAEQSIRELKRLTRSAMRRTSTPKRLWCYCLQWAAAIRRLTAMEKLDWRTPMEVTLGSTPDISQYAQFDWYEPVTYLERGSSFPEPRILTGRWLGVWEDATTLMSFMILTKSGEIIVRKDVWGISTEEMGTDRVKKDLGDLDAAILSKLGDHLKDGDSTIVGGGEPMTNPETVFEDEEWETTEAADPAALQADAEDKQSDKEFDNYLNATFTLQEKGNHAKATVISRRVDTHSLPIGKANPNPILDTREYNVQLPYGTMKCVTANLIAESILSQVDEEGLSFSILKDIINHRTTKTAIPKCDGMLTDKKGRQHKRITTRGWELEVVWQDGTSSWLQLKDLKSSNPLLVAEYAVANQIADEPAFAWWVRHVLRQRDRMILKVESRKVYQTNLKYGVQVPRTVKEALEIDRRTGTTFWADAIKKEMATVAPAFFFPDSQAPPLAHKFIKCHLIFDVKMDLTRKARYVAGVT